MKRFDKRKFVDLDKKTSMELVELFEDISLRMSEAENNYDVSKYNRLFHFYASIEKELKIRNDDERYLLFRFLDHPNLRVRLAAAKSTYKIAPERARAVIEQIAASQRFPHAGDAGMTLSALDDGTGKLD